ncbi:alpha/beta fold hydrolase [Myxococcus fulvus]|uniref:alpha/beta fold hydrolase n=1 Tax=Myxococcus fulvus TaxID=33 RepID=UPI003B9AEF4C
MNTKPQQGGYATVDDLKVYFEVHGGPLEGGKTPLVLLHGGMLAIETAFSKDLLPRFARSRPVIAMEMQGHGHTGDRPGPIQLERMVKDVAGVLAHLGVKRAHLLGHSLGGMIATGVCIHHPEVVASATLLSVTYTLEGMQPELVKMQRDPTHVPSPELIPLLPTEADFVSWKANFDKYNPDPSSFESVLARLNTLLTEWKGWSTAQLNGIRAPVLLALGDNDFTRLEHAAEMYRLIPGSKLAVLPDTTHMNIIERGAWLEPMVQELISRAEGA